ncbi:MAG: pyridoxamine 5'-phosphate oxidase family protein [Bdellovibrio sp.]|nr:pyridoxamine 5'-phosphate oxidase family protein [Bdellovibrio sp.]
MKFKKIISSEKQLREFYGAPNERSLLKQKDALDLPSKEFIQQSPFLCLATTNPNGSTDCSPKGDQPGFVKIVDDKTIVIPDRKGNNRLDSLVNIIHNPKIGLLFFIPGRNETLRVNGRAKICHDPEVLSEMSFKSKTPTVVVVVEIDEVYLHCPKALIRSDLWKRGVDIKDLKTYIKASRQQLGIELSEDEIAEKAKQYEESLKDTLY